MDRLSTLKLFVHIMEQGSFSAAARACNVSRPVASAAISDLEQKLGTRLLHRSTRHVEPTEDGRAYYEKCRIILAALEDADQIASKTVSGLLKVDVVGHLARTFILPALPDFLNQHPNLTLHLGEGERFVDLIREGIDCVIRAGTLPDSDMIVRSLGTLEEITVASPDYLARYGTPTTPDDLAGHQMIGFVSSRTGQPLPLEFTHDTTVRHITLPSRLLVNGAEINAAAALLGFGLAQAPRYRFAEHLANGSLVEVLPNFPPTPTPLSILYPSNRHLSPRVRVFMDWLTQLIPPSLLHQSRKTPPTPKLQDQTSPDPCTEGRSGTCQTNWTPRT